MLHSRLAVLAVLLLVVPMAAAQVRTEGLACGVPVDGRFISAPTGCERWASTHEGPARWLGAGLVDGRLVLAGTFYGEDDKGRFFARAVEAGTGATLWTVHETGPKAVARHVAVVGDQALLLGYDFDAAVAPWARLIDPTSGETLQRLGLASVGYPDAFTVADAAVYVAVDDGDGRVVGLDVADAASVRWSTPLPFEDHSWSLGLAVAADGDAVYALFATSEGDRLVALDAGTGALRWLKEVEVRSYVAWPPSGLDAADGRVVVVGTRGEEGLAMAIDADDGATLWERAFPSATDLVSGRTDTRQLSAVQIVGDRVVVGGRTSSQSRLLASLDVADGTVAWQREMSLAGGDSIGALLLAPDGEHVFGVSLAESVARGALVGSHSLADGALVWAARDDRTYGRVAVTDGSTLVVAGLGYEYGFRARSAAYDLVPSLWPARTADDLE